MYKTIIITLLVMVMAGTAWGVPTATPTLTPTTPTVTPTVTPTPLPQTIPAFASGGMVNVALRADFSELSTAAITDGSLINLRTNNSFTVPAGHRLFVTDITWSCESIVTAYLEWGGLSGDILLDKVYFPFAGQGKVVNYTTPITSLDAGINLELTTDRACTGWVFVGGYLQ